jgi:HSP20 family protein
MACNCGISYGRIEPETGRSIGFSPPAAPSPGWGQCRQSGMSEAKSLTPVQMLSLAVFTYYMTRMRPIPGGPLRSEPMMPIRQLEALMWAQACEAMDRADRLHRQFFHRAHATPCWEAPCDVFETDEVLTVVIALPGVELDQVKVTLSAGVLIVSGERSLPREVRNARIHRLEIPHGHFERRIELPPILFEISSRHLAYGCLMLQLHKL